MTPVRIGSVPIAAFLFGLAFSGPASAHHSIQAQFDIHKTVTISGTVANRVHQSAFVLT
jgi:hypothetical protein